MLAYQTLTLLGILSYAQLRVFPEDQGDGSASESGWNSQLQLPRGITVPAPYRRYDPTRISTAIRQKLRAFGGARQVYETLWLGAIDSPHYPCGFEVPSALIDPNQQEVRLLYEVGLLDRPRSGLKWIIYRDPGYDGQLRIIRSWPLPSAS